MVCVEVLISSSEGKRSNKSGVGEIIKKSICYLQVNGSELVSECVEGNKRVTGNSFGFPNASI